MAEINDAEVIKKVCSYCSNETESDRVYCPECGMLLDTVVRPPKNKIIMCVPGVEHYEGEATKGASNSNGEIFVYCNRLEYKKKAVIATISKTIGGLVNRQDEKVNDDDGAEIFYFKDMKEIKKGSYLRYIPTLVLVMKDGNAHTFVCIKNNGMADEIIGVINEYK